VGKKPKEKRQKGKKSERVLKRVSRPRKQGIEKKGFPVTGVRKGWGTNQEVGVAKGDWELIQKKKEREKNPSKTLGEKTKTVLMKSKR